MSGGKHTQAPWGIWGDNGEFCRIRSVKERSLIAIVPCGNTLANARLIAAAPETAAERDRLKEVNADLLAALKQFRTKVYNAALISGMDHEWATEACSRADAAIAKAEGGAA
ncbi:MAG: hypothetical protein ACK5VE_03695 [Alphaproteobacteria bacterium]